MTYEIGILPGEGIGIEVVDAVGPLMTTVADIHSVDISTTRYDWGVSGNSTKVR